MRFLTGVVLLAVAMAGAWAQEPAPVIPNAGDIVRQGRDLISHNDFAGAEKLLRQAVELNPKDVGAYSNLGYALEMQDKREEALTCYGQCLRLEPDNQYALRRFRTIFLEGRFPRWIRIEYLKLSPLVFIADGCRVNVGGAEQSRRFLYTTSLLFPEEMGRQGKALQVPIPASGSQSPGECTANRVCYGFVVRPDGQVADLRVALYYPSATISRSETNYSELAPQLMHILLRCSIYMDLHLDRKIPAAADEPLKVYMAELGPTGAEMWDKRIFLYDVDAKRSPEEWTRQVAHELGHYALPQVGRFSAPEAYANGMLGERLAMEWLACESELVTGKPWPDRQTQATLATLWVSDTLQISDYLVNSCLSDVAFWLQQGPDSQMLAAVGPEGFRYYVGFCLWLEAAHGSRMLAAVLNAAQGTQPGDFVFAYKQQVAQALASGELDISAGGCNLPVSKLKEQPLAGSTGWRQVTVADGDTLAFTVYLPAGEWSISVDAAQTADLQLAVNEGAPQPVGDGCRVRTEAGWQLVRLSRSRAGDPVQVNGLRVNTMSPALPNG